MKITDIRTSALSSSLHSVIPNLGSSFSSLVSMEVLIFPDLTFHKKYHDLSLRFSCNSVFTYNLYSVDSFMNCLFILVLSRDVP